MQNFNSILKLARNKNRFLTTYRAHHNGSKPQPEPSNDRLNLPNIDFPLWEILELGVYGCAFFYVIYSIKNKKTNPNLKFEEKPKKGPIVEPYTTPLRPEDTSYREGLRPIS